MGHSLSVVGCFIKRIRKRPQTLEDLHNVLPRLLGERLSTRRAAKENQVPSLPAKSIFPAWLPYHRIATRPLSRTRFQRP